MHWQNQGVCHDIISNWVERHWRQEYEQYPGRGIVTEANVSSEKLRREQPREHENDAVVRQLSKMEKSLDPYKKLPHL